MDDKYFTESSLIFETSIEGYVFPVDVGPSMQCRRCRLVICRSRSALHYHSAIVISSIFCLFDAGAHLTKMDVSDLYHFFKTFGESPDDGDGNHNEIDALVIRRCVLDFLFAKRSGAQNTYCFVSDDGCVL